MTWSSAALVKALKTNSNESGWTVNKAPLKWCKTSLINLPRRNSTPNWMIFRVMASRSVSGLKPSSTLVAVDELGTAKLTGYLLLNIKLLNESKAATF